MDHKRWFLLHALSGPSQLRCKSTMTSRCRMSPSGRRWRDRRMWLDHDNGSGRHRSCKFIEQRLRVLQVWRIKAFGEPVVDRGQQLIRLLALALALPQARQAGRCAQLPGFRLLPARPGERGEEVLLGAFKVALE